MTQPPALMTRGLSKSYGDVQALRDLDLEVRAGEIFGFLGPNGSGKALVQNNCSKTEILAILSSWPIPR
jgi:ABC-type branched-subunit amino acid transport system ATPase component